ncbi:GAF domain-containing protein [Frigoriglobus tundricola]|uniref:GAF domain-containing protein n=1 Tax=Frigoriglobus tundricola TaxID=2774151 RepID=A0A6M5YRL0_9BACT|nr:GAF domain-containing protein [Frigoriglobus tundricola]QJW95901.1 hypothetical protein FTUN_3455 [Frigoriglobus tundricola]
MTRGKLVRDRDGRPLRVDGTTTDVTRRGGRGAAVLDALEGVGATTGSAFLAKLTQHLCAVCGCRAAVVVEPHPLDPGAARAAAVWSDGRSAEPFALPAAGLVRDLLSGGGVLLPAAARDRHPGDPLLVKLRAEAFAAEPLADGTGRLLGFLAVADDRPFGAESDVRVVLKALAPRAAVELARGDDPAGGGPGGAPRRRRAARPRGRGGARAARPTSRRPGAWPPASRTTSRTCSG